MESNRWQIERAGLINFWYYDEEEFSFSDGRLLLRGSNGSGKSVTMQSFIPLLLDGNRSPERLDPFGSKARKMENYLLGEDENGKDECTAYLYMEFKKKQSGNFITIGMGFKAVRNKPLQSWGFSITDGRRVGRDFYLYKNIGEKIPLSKKELENRISSGGRVTDSQGDYMKMVNDLLFGFDEVDEYDELIKLLVQLRSPKLSKDFKPTVIYEILENSLQQLSEDDLRPMSEAIENMDNIKSRLEELKESKKASDRIKNYYDRYNNAVLLEKSKALLKCFNDIEKLKKDKRELEQKKNTAKEEYEKAKRNIEDFKISQETSLKKREELEKHDSVRIKEKIVEIERNTEDLNREEIEKNRQMDEKKRLLIREENSLKEYKGREDAEAKKIEDSLVMLDELSGGFAFDEQGFMKDELMRDIKSPYDFNYIKAALKRHISNIEKAAGAIEEKDRKNTEYDRILSELEKARQEKNIRSKKLDEAEVLLEETKQELIENVYLWNKKNAELKLSDDALRSISRCINNFEAAGYDEITSIIRPEYNAFESSFNKNMARLEIEQKAIKDSKKEIEMEIDEWKNKKEPEPVREQKVLLNRKRLEDEKIPYIPLYRAVDFLPDINDMIRGRIEEALVDMGLIDALIVPKSYKDKIFNMDSEMADRYIFASPKFLTHGLYDFLKPENINIQGIGTVDIEDAIKSIVLDGDSNSTYIDGSGRYGIGILKGRTSQKGYTAKFIGASARNRYREEKINSLTEERCTLQYKLDELQSQIDSLEKRLKILKTEFDGCPDGQDMTVASNEVREARFNLEKISAEVSQKEEDEKNAYKELKALEQNVYELTHRISLKANIEVYKEAIEDSRDYTEHLYELEKHHINLVQINENIIRIGESAEQTELDIDNIASDINNIGRKLKEAKMQHDSLIGQLKLSNYEEIKNEIDECIRLIKELPLKIEKEISKRESENSKYLGAQDDLINLCPKIDLFNSMLSIYKESFKEEIDLGYVVQRKEEDLIKSAGSIVKEIEDKFQKDEATEQLFAKYQENSQYLREYIVKIDSIFEREQEADNPEITEALSKCRRLNITGKVRGRDVDFYTLMDFINEGIDENEKLLKESDRELFEDILVKNISKKIRAKIYHSQQWVRKMNDLMESMNTSSGLSFSLSWGSKRAETEDQLDTRELVELLKQEGSLMKEQDLNKLSDHFRSKISEARRIQEDTGKTQTFHTIMKEILDYRKWFEFKLYYTKTGQNKKELTNNAFYQFSGGEKAMAMYVPLFSAVYARYEGSRPEAPRIISLDEAFAGVDEKNISDMFRLLNELNLDFIMNSQILWGDYDTVPSLSICELIRPDNADFVTVIRYLWNGKVKQVVA